MTFLLSLSDCAGAVRVVGKQSLLPNPAKVCVADGQPGLSNKNGQTMEFEGLEPDVARYVVETLNGENADIEFVTTTFPERIDFIKDGKCDFLVELLTNTAGRRLQVGFTSPYLSPAAEILVLSSSSVNETSQCANVALVENSATQSSFQAAFPNVPLLEFVSNEDAVKSVADGDASCAASEDLIFKRILEQVDAAEIAILEGWTRSDFRRVSTGNTFAPKPWGIGVNMERVQLRAEIDAIMIYAEMSGKLRELREKHGFGGCLACA